MLRGDSHVLIEPSAIAQEIAAHPQTPVIDIGAQSLPYQALSPEPVSYTHLRAHAVSYTHLRAHETRGNLVCRLLLEKNFFNDTATTEIYTRKIVGSVRCV